MQEKVSELQNEALEAAAEHIRQQRNRNANSRLVAVCLTCLLIVAIICATVLGCNAIMAQQETIREQQYALNMQYAGLSVTTLPGSSSPSRHRLTYPAKASSYRPSMAATLRRFGQSWMI